MNKISEVSENWQLSLTPRPNAFVSDAAVDGHNVWRNSKIITSPLDLPTSIPATVPGCIHTDLMDAGFIADISVDGREVDQMWIWKTDSVYRTTLPKSATKSTPH